MAFKIKLQNISVSNTYRVYYRKSRTPGSVTVQSSDWSTNGGTYVGEYPSSTTSVDITIPNVEYGSQYWVKILDTFTNSYSIENIYIHERQFYNYCLTCCDFFAGTSEFITYEPTPTPTPTSTPTPVPIDCSFSGGTSDWLSSGDQPTPTPIPPTPTPIPPTPTPTPTGTPTPTPTPTQVGIEWTLGNKPGGRLIIYDKNNVELLNQITSGALIKTGTLYVQQNLLPYTIEGLWNSGSDNTVRFRICDITNGGELYSSIPITVSEGSDQFTVTPTPYFVSVYLTSNNVIPPICPE